jgi:16S rRNA (cytosine967-C5)-methyltransferase
VFRAEGEGQVEAFLERHPQARRLPAPGHMLPAADAASPADAPLPQHGLDGFFNALFAKPLD